MLSVFLTNVKGNTFAAGTDLFEFIHAFGSVWIDNTYPSDACYKNVMNEEVPTSTFGSTSGFPGLC